jgi:hypothetical protein
MIRITKLLALLPIFVVCCAAGLMVAFLIGGTILWLAFLLLTLLREPIISLRQSVPVFVAASTTLGVVVVYWYCRKYKGLPPLSELRSNLRSHRTDRCSVGAKRQKL